MFSLDKDATLTVTARDKQSGKVEVKKKVFFSQSNQSFSALWDHL